MSANVNIESRLTDLEREVADLKRQIARWRRRADSGNWIRRISGTFKGDPDFKEILRLGREIREADRPSDD